MSLPLHVNLFRDWLTDWLSDWLTEWLTDWVTKWLTEWVSDWVSDWLTEWVTEWLTDLVTDWLTDWVSEWVTDWVTDWLTDSCVILYTLHYCKRYLDIKRNSCVIQNSWFGILTYWSFVVAAHYTQIHIVATLLGCRANVSVSSTVGETSEFRKFSPTFLLLIFKMLGQNVPTSPLRCHLILKRNHHLL